MTVYRSKIGLELTIPLTILFGGIFAIFIVNGIWQGLFAPAGAAAFTAYVFLSIRYTIHNGQLLVKSGFLYTSTIPIASIVSVHPSRNPISAPAATLDRMEVRYGNGQSVLISPAEKQAFLNHLLKVNPNIRIDVPGFR
ncbi:MAG: PH domain-containing protein [Bacteroidetes bacterium]|nr:PH domain-containing protein [Bacteroidota bacterium]